MTHPLAGKPRLILGTAQWASPYGVANRTGPPDRDELQRMLRLAGRHEVFTLDTARAYPGAERILGQLVGSDPTWTIHTKLAPDVVDNGTDKASALKRVEASLNASRTALKREQLDGVLLHRAEHRTALGGAIWEALQTAQTRGRIVRLGVSARTPQQAFDALGDPEVTIVQVAANLLDQRLPGSGFFDNLPPEKTVVVRSVYMQGLAFLAPDELPAPLHGFRSALVAIHRWAEKHGMSAADAFFQYARALGPAALVVGCENYTQLQHNLTLWQQPVPEGLAELASLISEPDESLVDPANWP